MLEHYIVIGLATLAATVIVCWVAHWIFKRFDNPFDNLDESDLEEFDHIGEVLINVAGMGHPSSPSVLREEHHPNHK